MQTNRQFFIHSDQSKSQPNPKAERYENQIERKNNIYTLTHTTKSIQTRKHTKHCLHDRQFWNKHYTHVSEMRFVCTFPAEKKFCANDWRTLHANMTRIRWKIAAAQRHNGFTRRTSNTKQINKKQSKQNMHTLWKIWWAKMWWKDSIIKPYGIWIKLLFEFRFGLGWFLADFKY